MGIGTHYRCAPRCIHRCFFLPDDCPHVIKANGFAETDNLSSDGNNLVAAVIDSPGKLISDINNETAPRMKHTVTFFPDQVQMVNIALVRIVKSYLIIIPIIL